MPKVLIVDDERPIRDAVRMILKYESIDCVDAGDARAALRAVHDDPEISAVLCDVKMPGADGIDALEQMKAQRPSLPVIMISGHGNVETAVEATRKGAFDFLEKPIDRDRLLLTIRNAIGAETLRRQNQTLREELAARWKIMGSSAAIAAVRDTIKRVAESAARVLVIGEHGTGKELVARNVHLLSDRASGPFVDVNCAAIPKELIESELFGHEKGAFTGADARKIGKFEEAEGGTLFLDEIGDMDLAAQAKLLRVLEENKVQRVGGQGAIAVDVRVVAATNKDLEALAKEGKFREDLYYRLNVIPIRVPPLRDRIEDVPEIFLRFFAEYARRYRRPELKVSPDALAELKKQPWPGNVRELRNFAERAALLAPGPEVDAEQLRGIGAAKSADPSNLFAIDNFEAFQDASEKAYLLRKLEENGWNIKRTAERLGMQRSNMYKKIDRYGLRTANDEPE
ncbi:MAG TPA: sigma-54 dependent transcriptional regulator [Planctomycetota bacterium]|nr:sigma-54 dependent transcriptional regulator [Planctomycetota bacterium]